MKLQLRKNTVPTTKNHSGIPMGLRHTLGPKHLAYHSQVIKVRALGGHQVGGQDFEWSAYSNAFVFQRVDPDAQGIVTQGRSQQQ